MNSIIRLLGLCSRTLPIGPMAALEDILDLLEQESGADIILLPRHALCPPSCQALLRSKTVRDAVEEAFSGLLLRSRTLEGYLALTTLFWEGGVPVESAGVLHKGEYLRLDARGCAPDGEPALFQMEDLTFCVLPGPPEKLPVRIPEILRAGCGLVLAPCYEPVYAGSIRRANQALAAVSAVTGCTVLAVSGGVGDTSSPHLYGGYITVADGGEIAAHRAAQMDGITLCYDADSDLNTARRDTPPARAPLWERPCVNSKAGLRRKIGQTPYLPPEGGAREEYLAELFELQARALAARLDNTGLRRMILGVSGGLDSTLALLVCAQACDLLGLGRERILGVTMPGFGTSDRTYFNALQLMEQLGTDTRDIPISGAVSAHFEDISHNPAQKDAVYENAQARERAQVLFDLANQQGGIVVGTGDLSEAALGFSTFGGDHLAGYNVNICLNKTTIRALVGHLARVSPSPDVRETLQDILDTPISPELLPLDASGDPLQKSEEILGPYILHDFFLYYTLQYSLTPRKIREYASIAFAGDFSPDFIGERLRIFIRRFYQSQFKRSCAPDSADIARPCLNGWYVPADMNAQVFLSELE